MGEELHSIHCTCIQCQLANTTCLISDLIAGGQIKTGMTIAQLKSLIGEPDEFGGQSRKYKMPCLFKYGNIEVAFTSARNYRESATQRLVYVMTEDHEFLLRETSRCQEIP